MIWKYLLKTIGILGVGLITLFIFFIGYSVTVEGYNRFSPWIDTKTTDDFSEEKFDLIKVGMDTTQVKNIIGKPYFRQDAEWDSLRFQLWYFTSDGKFKKGDFAWIGREIYIDNNGKVNEIMKTIHYD